MSGFTHENPGGVLTNQERWLYIFTRKSFLATLIAVVFSFGLFRLMAGFGLTIPGLIIGVFIVLMVYLITTLKVPEGYLLYGQGLTIDIILLRILLRKSNKIIYVKNYVPGGED